MSGAGDHKGRPYGFVPEFKGLGICSMERPIAGLSDRPIEQLVADA